MAERKIISAAIAPEANERIEALAEKLGLSKSNLIANMLESFLPTAEELTREDILDGAEDPDLQPSRESVNLAAEGETGSEADDDSGEDNQPEHAEEGTDAETEEGGEEDEEVTGDAEGTAPAPVRARPAAKPKAKLKAKKGKK